MALNIPINFNHDLQSRDTKLIPLIVIGSYDGAWPVDYTFISTNEMRFLDKDSYDIFDNSLPLLLNIPSLKESIDPETRRYKISSINLDISNLPYNGTRFSERFIDDSLIGTEVRIFWTSPSSIKAYFYDLDSTEGDALGERFLQIYFGNIKKYTHSAEKARLMIEDKSQSKLHKDLPSVSLETSGLVPDKYKTVPVPMCYGHVDKSPCVIKVYQSTYTLLFNYGNLNDENNAQGLVSNSSFYDNSYGSFIASPVMIFGDDQYIYLDESIKYIYQYLYEDPYFLEQNYIEELVNNDIKQWTYIINGVKLVDNFLLDQNINQGLIASRPSKVRTGGMAADEEILSDLVDHDPTTSYTGNVFYSTYYHGLGQNGPVEGIAEDILHGQHYYFQMPDYLASRPLGLLINNTNIPLPTITYSDDIPITPRTIITESVLNASEEVSFKNKYGSDVIFYTIDNVAGLNLTSIFKLHTATDYEEPPVGMEAFTFSVYLDPDLLSVSKVIPHFILRLDHPVMKIMAGVYCSVTAPNNTWYIASWFDFKIQELLGLFSTDIKGGISKDFYVDVEGRKMIGSNSPTSLSVISNILSSEVGEDISTEGLSSNYDDWKYAFSVTEKTNSKLLIEDLSSASPYIPRFDNMGNFKINEIPLGGGSITTNPDGSPSENHTIKDVDIIDFSFSKTDINSVFSKIIFKFNWDYGRKKFNDSISAEIGLILEDYKLDYYGFKGTATDEHSESTLIIDDHRGKFIRDYDTALDFAYWYLLWSCNQKLKMKIQLPLKYLNLEIGDFIDFDSIIGGIKPYNIDYISQDDINGQIIYPIFLITATNKKISSVEIECIQLHNLDVACVEDCLGVCFGDAYIDDCGVCVTEDIDYGDCGCDGLEDGACDCDGNVMDCAGVCGGTAEEDDCGECAGDNTSCTPIADAGPDQVIHSGDFTQLNAYTSGSQTYVPEGGNLIWSQISGDIVELSCTECAIANFTAPYTEQQMEFRLTSEHPFDNDLHSYDNVIIDIINDAPTADAGPDQEVSMGTTVYLNGSASTDDSFDETNATWENLGPGEGVGEEITINCNNDACFNPSFISPDVGEEDSVSARSYTFKLTVTDPTGLYDTDQVTILINYVGEDECPWLIGDVNNNGGWNVLDIVIVANCVLEDNCEDSLDEGACAADLNGDGSYNVLDVVTVANCVLNDNCGDD